MSLEADPVIRLESAVDVVIALADLKAGTMPKGLGWR